MALSMPLPVKLSAKLTPGGSIANRGCGRR